MSPEPCTELEALLTDYQRRVTVDEQLHFQKSIATDERGLDEIDRASDGPTEPAAVIDLS